MCVKSNSMPKQQQDQSHLAEARERRLELAATGRGAPEHHPEPFGRQGPEDRGAEQQAGHDLADHARLAEAAGHGRSRPGGQDDHGQLHEQRPQAPLGAGGEQDRQAGGVRMGHGFGLGGTPGLGV
jgi:hypothetical protein